ncbi:unnamed protein product [Closterium sp. Naga37s-1]|nr:unnamed protein product [Closterium sp. Naga37s-1]
MPASSPLPVLASPVPASPVPASPVPAPSATSRLTASLFTAPAAPASPAAPSAPPPQQPSLSPPLPCSSPQHHHHSNPTLRLFPSLSLPSVPPSNPLFSQRSTAPSLPTLTPTSPPFPLLTIFSPSSPPSLPTSPSSLPASPPSLLTSSFPLLTSPHSLPTSAPSLPTSAPSLPTSAPSLPTSAPSLPTSAPSLPTSAPSLPTSAPSLPTSAPSLPTSAPSLPTSAPSLPTSAPSLPTSAPSLPTSAPSLPTSAPSLPTSAPSLPTSAPSTPYFLLVPPTSPPSPSCSLPTAAPIASPPLTTPQPSSPAQALPCVLFPRAGVGAAEAAGVGAAEAAGVGAAEAAGVGAAEAAGVGAAEAAGVGAAEAAGVGAAEAAGVGAAEAAGVGAAEAAGVGAAEAAGVGAAEAAGVGAAEAAGVGAAEAAGVGAAEAAGVGAAEAAGVGAAEAAASPRQESTCSETVERGTERQHTGHATNPLPILPLLSTPWLPTPLPPSLFPFPPRVAARPALRAAHPRAGSAPLPLLACMLLSDRGRAHRVLLQSAPTLRVQPVSRPRRQAVKPSSRESLCPVLTAEALSAAHYSHSAVPRSPRTMADLGNADRPAQGTARGGSGAAPGGGDKGLIPRSNKEYLNIEYWDKRFEVEESFEWCGDYSQFKHLLLTHIRPCDRVLILGNGTSDLPECLSRDGRRHITATDLSALVVHRMAQRSTALGSSAMGSTHSGTTACTSAVPLGAPAAPAAPPAAVTDTAPDATHAAARDCTGTSSEAAAHTAIGEAPGGTQPTQHQHQVQQQQSSSPPATPAGSSDVGAVAGGREGQVQHACACNAALTLTGNGNTAAHSSNGGEACNSSGGGSSDGGGGMVCRCGRAAGITWAVADMMALPFPDACFDVVLEKGVLDVLLVDSDSPWHVAPPIVQRVHTALSQAHRMLTSHGRLLSITFGQPHFRRPLYEAPHLTWTLQHTAFGDSFHYFLLHLAKCPPPTLTSHHPFAVTLYCSSLSLRATQGTRTPTVTDNTPAADGDSESAGLVITLPQSSDAQPPLDLEHEFMDSDDFFSHCSLGLD